MNKISKVTTWIIFILSITVCNLYAESLYKNVIVLMTDGTSSTHTTLSRWYKGSLALDEMNVSAVRTYGSNSIITDSAPATTAFATGHKSEDKFVVYCQAKQISPGFLRHQKS